MSWFLWLIVALYAEVAILVLVRLFHILYHHLDIWTLPAEVHEAPSVTSSFAEDAEYPPTTVVTYPTAWQQRLHRTRLIVRSIVSAVTWLPQVLWEGGKVMWRELAK